MRILFFSSIFPHGTARVTGTFNLELCRALGYQHQVRIIAPRSFLEILRTHKEGFAADKWVSQNYGLEVSYPSYFYSPGFARSWYGESMWLSVRRHVQAVVATFRPEAVVSYWAHPDGEVALRAAEQLGIPSVVIVGGSDVLILPKNPRRRTKIQRVLRESSAVMTISEGLRREVIQLGTDPRQVHTIYQGVDDELFFPGAPAVARQRLGLMANRRLLLWVGRMVDVKGLDTLIAAFDQAHQREPDLHLLLVGDGPRRSVVENDVKQRDLVESVTFVGPRHHSELPDWYRAADAILLSSRSEGLPNVLREAVACGRPFVSTDVGSVREFANAGDGTPFAELVPVGNAEAMALAIQKVLRPEYADAARSVPCRSWRDTADELVALLRGLRGERPDVLQLASSNIRSDEATV